MSGVGYEPTSGAVLALVWASAPLFFFKNMKGLKVTVVDGYLCDGQTEKLKVNARKFFGLFPKRELSVFLSRAKKLGIADVKKLCNRWKVKHDTNPRYRNAHDRYVLIDGKMEIVITSGIDYLFDTDKECTLLVRKVTQ